MIKIGLTGNIASGKSEVEKIISHLGYLCVDLDIVSHDILQNNEEAKAKILKEFFTLDRKQLAQIVFYDDKRRQSLQNIIYPYLKEFILKKFIENNDKDLIFISGALIYEAGFDYLFDKIIFVDCDKNLRLKRLMKRNNMEENEAKNLINIQNDLNKTKADYIIKNDGDLDSLREKIQKIINEIPYSQNIQ